jgi:hypothetical protein
MPLAGIGREVLNRAGASKKTTPKRERAPESVDLHVRAFQIFGENEGRHEFPVERRMGSSPA